MLFIGKLLKNQIVVKCRAANSFILQKINQTFNILMNKLQNCPDYEHFVPVMLNVNLEYVYLPDFCYIISAIARRSTGL